MKKQRRFRIGSKMYLFVSTIVLLIAGSLIAISYRVHAARSDQFYMEMTTRIARTAATSVDGDFIEQLTQAVESAEYQALRKEAEAADTPERIAAWLAERGLDDAYGVLETFLNDFRDDMEIRYLYVASAKGSYSVALIDPDEPATYLGQLVPTVASFGDVYNVSVPPTVSRSDYGWLCSAYEPILNSQGEAVAVVGVDIDMSDVMAERHGFLAAMLLFGLLVGTVAAVCGALFMRGLVTKPLERLAGATKKFTDEENGFSREHIAQLSIANNDEIGDLYQEIQSMEGHIVDYISHIEEITAEKERIGAELSVATQIQADMLPRIFPPFPERHEFDLYATMTPAKEVGGDFYDFFLVDDDHLALVMADVSGKGVPAALFMVIAKTLIKNRAQMGGSPSEVLAYANDQLCEGNEAELFVTVWLAIIEISTGRGLAANAGHEHPALRRAGGEFELVKYRHSPAVATMEGVPFSEHEFELHPGDTLYVYTDGVAEATNGNDELFDTDRMLAALNEAPDASAQKLLRTVKERIDQFVGEAPQFDDITMLGLTWYGGKEDGNDRTDR